MGRALLSVCCLPSSPITVWFISLHRVVAIIVHRLQSLLAHAIAGSRHISEGNGKYEGVMNKLRESKEGGRYD